MYLNIKINNRSVVVNKDFSILEACKFLGIAVPRFCYHENLSIAGNCRMCLVETDKAPKPVAACAAPLVPNMSIFTNSAFILKARENVLETLLLNHPLDCPICDQAGECDLQNQSKHVGNINSRFFFKKRGVEDKNGSSLIKMVMTRCIHCTRCVRFGAEIIGNNFFGTLGRGTTTEIGNYTEYSINSEISGNVIDLCPVGALTSKAYTFKIRPWEMQSIESVDLTDSVGSNIFLHYKTGSIMRIIPKKNSDLNDTWISDKARFSFDYLKYNRVNGFFEGSTLINKTYSYSLSPFSLDILVAKANFFKAFLNKKQFLLSANTIVNSVLASKKEKTATYNIDCSQSALNVENISIKSGNHLLKNTSKFHFFNNFSTLLQLLQGQTIYNQKKLFLIKSSTDLKTLLLLKNLEYLSKGSINVRLPVSLNKKSNFYEWGNKSRIQNINLTSKSKLCFICSSNIKIENTLLNLKLRLKFNKCSLDIFNLGLYFQSNFNVTFLSLKLHHLFLIVSSKNKIISKKLLEFSNSIFIVGENLYNRFKNLDILLKTLKKYIPSMYFYLVTQSNNYEGSEFCFFKALSKRTLLRSNNVIALNIEDTISIQKLLFQTCLKTQNIFWCSTHRTTGTSKVKQLFPVKSDLEEGGIYLNFEQKIQVANGLPAIYSIPSIKMVVQSFLFAYQTIESSKSSKANLLSSQQYLDLLFFDSHLKSLLNSKEKLYSFITEVINNPSLSKYETKASLALNNDFIFKTLICSLNTYPTKGLLEDFYRSNLNVKNSLIMLQSSREARKFQNLFTGIA